MNLDLVLGMSCNNISSLACDPTSGLVAHAASGVLVILDTETNSQVKYLHLRKNSVSSVNFSPDGKYLVTGEIGYKPAVRVWKVKDGQEVATLLGHEFGIKCVLFCPTMDEIVSVGLEHDNEVNVWAWPDKHRLATNKIVDVVKAVAYSECGTFFVTAGSRHLKFWYPKLTLAHISPKAVPIVQPLYGRPGILVDCKHHTFLDVVCGNARSYNFVYAITNAGGLIIVNALNRHLVCYKNIEGYRGTCLKAHDQILFIGFSNGDIHMFNSLNLAHLAALPVLTFFRRTGSNGGGVFTMAFNPYTTLLTAAYKNSSMCVWDLKDSKKIRQKYVAVYHSEAIANFDMFTTMEEKDRTRETMVTVSHDSTVRLWGIVITKAICYDRLSILYTDATPMKPDEKQSRMLDNSGIITAVKVSPDKNHIITGNRAGSICVYNRETYEHLLTVLAHNREVTCLAFYSNRFGRSVLISGSRDRLIHVMNVNSKFRLITTLNIHSSSITALKVCEMDDTICIISCGADRNLSVCTAPVQNGLKSLKPPMFQLSRCATSVSSPADITIDVVTKHLAMGCQDGNVRVFDMAALLERRMFRGCPSVDGQIHKICLDKQCALLLTAASDKTINIINFCTGDILTTMTGHTKCVTGLVFSPNGGHVITTSMDSCIFIWRLQEKMITKRKEICFCRDFKRYGHKGDDLDSSHYFESGSPGDGWTGFGPEASFKIISPTSSSEAKRKKQLIIQPRSPKNRKNSRSPQSSFGQEYMYGESAVDPENFGKPFKRVNTCRTSSSRSWVTNQVKTKRPDRNRSNLPFNSRSETTEEFNSVLESVPSHKQDNELVINNDSLLVSASIESADKSVMKNASGDVCSDHEKETENLSLSSTILTESEKKGDNLCPEMSHGGSDKHAPCLQSDRAEDLQQRKAAGDSMLVGDNLKQSSQSENTMAQLSEQEILCGDISPNYQCIEESRFQSDLSTKRSSLSARFIDQISQENVMNANYRGGDDLEAEEEFMTSSLQTLIFPNTRDRLKSGSASSHNFRYVFTPGVTKTVGRVDGCRSVLISSEHSVLTETENSTVSDGTKSKILHHELKNFCMDCNKVVDYKDDDGFPDNNFEGSSQYCPRLSCSFPLSAQEKSELETRTSSLTLSGSGVLSLAAWGTDDSDNEAWTESR